jgi:hypothetical protein
MNNFLLRRSDQGNRATGEPPIEMQPIPIETRPVPVETQPAPAELQLAHYGTERSSIYRHFGALE